MTKLVSEITRLTTQIQEVDRQIGQMAKAQEKTQEQIGDLGQRMATAATRIESIEHQIKALDTRQQDQADQRTSRLQTMQMSTIGWIIAALIALLSIASGHIIFH